MKDLTLDMTIEEAQRMSMIEETKYEPEQWELSDMADAWELSKMQSEKKAKLQSINSAFSGIISELI